MIRLALAGACYGCRGRCRAGSLNRIRWRGRREPWIAVCCDALSNLGGNSPNPIMPSLGWNQTHHQPGAILHVVPNYMWPPNPALDRYRGLDKSVAVFHWPFIRSSGVWRVVRW